MVLLLIGSGRVWVGSFLHGLGLGLYPKPDETRSGFSLPGVSLGFLDDNSDNLRTINN